MPTYNILICSLIALLIGFSSQKSHALNMHELNIYGYETNDPHEYEIENQSSLTSDQTFRTSMELSYGLNEHTAIAMYLDYERSQYSALDLTAFRAHLIRSFFRRNQLPVNLALYVETEIPQFSDEAYTIETKLIIEKNIGQLDVILTPGFEYVRLKEKNGEGQDYEIENNFSAALKYHLNDRLTPNLIYIADLNESNDNRVTLVGLDFNVKHGFSIGAAIGQNQDSENIVKTSFEFEIE